MTYSDKLKDPRWQKKRLEVMLRDGFKCTKCNDAETTLNVHHLKYLGDPWDAHLDDLETLCCHCHEATEIIKKAGVGIVRVTKRLSDSKLKKGCLFVQDTENIISVFGIEGLEINSLFSLRNQLLSELNTFFNG